MEQIKKEALYKKTIKELDAVFAKKDLDYISIMAEVNAVLKINIPHLSFVGFYGVRKNKDANEKVLRIGPYQGNMIACFEIPFTRGVCGKCALEEKIINVPDTSKFPGYIACDDLTKSEIVIPVKKRGKLIAVLDIDSSEPNSFDVADEFYLEKITKKYF